MEPVRRKLGFADGFEQLEVFKRAYRISLEIHRKTLAFPQAEQMGGMADQMRRASKSICANLAEGFGKNASPSDVRRFILMSLGSSEEMRVWLRYCLDLQLIDQFTWEAWKVEYSEISLMLRALGQKMRKKTV